MKEGKNKIWRRERRQTKEGGKTSEREKKAEDKRKEGKTRQMGRRRKHDTEGKKEIGQQKTEKREIRIESDVHLHGN
jgi:hypothetical protein